MIFITTWPLGQVFLLSPSSSNNIRTGGESKSSICPCLIDHAKPTSAAMAKTMAKGKMMNKTLMA